MTQQFASIELARLYESQGYFEDALAMYRILDDEGGHSEGPEVRAAITRLEGSMEGRGKPAPLSDGLDFEKMIAEVNGPAMGGEPEPDQEASPLGVAPETEQEERLARLLEKWLMLMVAQRRVRTFKAIREKV